MCLGGNCLKHVGQATTAVVEERDVEDIASIRQCFTVLAACFVKLNFGGCALECISLLLL